MNYNLYLNYKVDLDLDINDDSGSQCENIFADIMHETDEAVSQAAGNEEPKRTKIGFLYMLYYNQALARSYGLDTTQIRELTLKINSKALIDLDPNHITQETIDEIGAVTNPNIMMLQHFGIAAAWRNKGIGEQVLKGLIKQMKGRCGYIIILDGQPEQHSRYTGTDSFYDRLGVELAGLENDEEKAQFKLNAFWQKCGFRQFKNYNNVFVCNVEKAVPGRLQLKQFAI